MHALFSAHVVAAIATPAVAPDGSWMLTLTGRLHPIAVHFPIAFLLLAAGAEAVRLLRRRPGPSLVAAVSLVLGAAGAAFAAVSGWMNAATGEFGGRTAELLETHRWLGVGASVTAVAAAGLCVRLRRGPSRALSYIYMAVLFGGAAAVGLGGHYGGMVVHGERYIADALPFGRPDAVAAAPAAAAPWAPGQAVDFVRHVQPLLRGACYECHGPEKQKGGLRLDSKDLAFKGGTGGPAVLPGNAAASPLLVRILGQGGGDRMPLKKEPLADAQAAVIRAWIDQGAVWPDAASVAGAKIEKHWAYVKPVRPELPALRGHPNGPGDSKFKIQDSKPWIRNPIDAFVLARLEKEGLAPSPEAARETLIRRVSLDLTGLPPAPEEVDAFLADGAPDAYEKVVDRLLASPHFGERWARPWLDLARYADTHGYEIDRRRAIWKYRDWVIDAFNRDLPFDRFTIEQIAGDMLAPSGAEGRPNATVEQRIATGFHRNTTHNQEAGVDVQEVHFEVLVDRVNTTATAWLGATMGCAQCHNHKYDPFTQQDYYRFMAFFSNTEWQFDNTFTKCHEAALEMPTPEQEKKRAELQAEIAKQNAVLNTPTPELAAAQAAWEKDWQEAHDSWTAVEAEGATSTGGGVMQTQDDRSILVSGTPAETDTYEVTARTSVRGITGVRLEAMTHSGLPHNGPGRDPNGVFVVTGVVVEELAAAAPPPPAPGGGGAPAETPASVVARPVAFANAVADNIAAGHDPRSLIDGRASSPGWAIDPLEDAARVDRQAILVAAAPVANEAGRLRVRVRQDGGGGQSVGRFRLSVTAAPDPTRILSVPAPIRAVLLIVPDRRTDAQRTQIAAHYRSIAPALQPARARVAELNAAVTALGIPSTLVMKEKPGFERPSALFRHRGSFLNPGDRLYADVPAALPPLPPSAPPNRLGLAQWLVDPENPLTARVTVNRFWEQLFGRGIVETSEDFGVQGERPTHPELLDWLAVEFREPTWQAETEGKDSQAGPRHLSAEADRATAEGAAPPARWSMKTLIRLIVTSATYRQSSRVTPALLEKDPYNRLFARGPRFRMEAEMLRDNALAAGGLLDRRIGGPSVFPHQPDGIWFLLYGSDHWKMSEGADRYRRGLYTFWRRTAPYPAFLTFDAPDRNACTARRPRTNTPLQALNMMNDPVHLEAARGLARRVAADAAAPADRVDRAYRIVLARKPSAAERDEVLALVARGRERYAADPGAAGRLLAGEFPAPAGADPADLAAWTLAANTLLNLDEAVTKE